MEALPPEVLVHIAPFLSVEDLAACCAVSLWWRDIFGCDEVWRPRCDVMIAEYLETTPCRVEPKFLSPQPEDVSLSPIGRWRLAFMRETHLWRNWIHGNYKTEETDLKIKGTILFLNSDLVIMLNKNMLMLSDTSVSPSVCVAQLKVYPSEHEWFTPTVVKSDMVVTVNNGSIVRVIEVDLEKLALSIKHSFCVDDSLRGRDLYIAHFVVNTVFLGFENECIYIWDLVSGTKLRTEHLSLNRPSMIQSKNCEDVVITGTAGDGLCHYLIYNTKELTFWPLVFYQRQYNECVIIKDYLAISFGVTLRVYKYKTSKLLFEVPMTRLLSPSVHVLKGSFIYMNNDVLQQLVPSSGSTRCIMKSDLATFMPIGEKLLLVLFNAHKQLQIWRIGPVSTVKTLMPYIGPMEINETFSKVLLVRSGVSFLYFW